MTEPSAAVPAPKKRESKAPTASHRAEMVALRGVIAALGALPFDTAGRIGARLGSLGYRPLGIRRRVVERQIAAAFPEMSPTEVAETSRRAYAHVGRAMIETALLPRIGKKGVLEM